MRRTTYLSNERWCFYKNFIAYFFLFRLFSFWVKFMRERSRWKCMAMHVFHRRQPHDHFGSSLMVKHHKDHPRTQINVVVFVARFAFFFLPHFWALNMLFHLHHLFTYWLNDCVFIIKITHASQHFGRSSHFIYCWTNVQPNCGSFNCIHFNDKSSGGRQSD